ncbi:hypothetical protein ACWEL8_09705 [Streptomyces sp. NPDC004690]
MTRGFAAAGSPRADGADPATDIPGRRDNHGRCMSATAYGLTRLQNVRCLRALPWEPMPGRGVR